MASGSNWGFVFRAGDIVFHGHMPGEWIVVSGVMDESGRLRLHAHDDFALNVIHGCDPKRCPLMATPAAIRIVCLEVMVRAATERRYRGARVGKDGT